MTKPTVGPVPRSATFDYLISLAGLWIVGGFFLDAWAHGHVPVETFFTPYHGLIYSGMLAGLTIVAGTVIRNRLRGYAWRDTIPAAYRWPLVGVPVFIAAGFGDLLWHRFLGVEEGVDALLSPTHQMLGLGVFLITSGPICSALANRHVHGSLTDQLPAIFSLATWLELVHFGTAYAFDPAADHLNAPLSVSGFTPDTLTLLTIQYYKLGYGVLVVVFQSIAMAAFALFAVRQFALRPGALTVFFVLGNFMAAAAFTNDTPLLFTTIVMSLSAGIVADLLIHFWQPGPQRTGAFRVFAMVVPASYYAAYFITTAATSGIWWDWNVVLGSLGWAAAVGLGLTFLSLPSRSW